MLNGMAVKYEGAAEGSELHEALGLFAPMEQRQVLVVAPLSTGKLSVDGLDLMAFQVGMHGVPPTPGIVGKPPTLGSDSQGRNSIGTPRIEKTIVDRKRPHRPIGSESPRLDDLVLPDRCPLPREIGVVIHTFSHIDSKATNDRPLPVSYTHLTLPTKA